MLSSSTQHNAVDYCDYPSNFLPGGDAGGDVSRTSPQSPVLGSSREVLGVQEDQVGPSDPATPRVPLGPADLATLLDPRLPARHVKTPQETKTPGWGGEDVGSEEVLPFVQEGH